MSLTCKGAAMKKKENWIVTASPDMPLDDFAKQLTKAGFTVRDVLKEVGSITGSAEKATLAKIRNIRGIADVSPDMPIDVGPPESDKTW